jgi:hypothetical protein
MGSGMIRRFKIWLCRRLCGDLIWNRDMSLELDAKQKRIDELEERIGH